MTSVAKRSPLTLFISSNMHTTEMLSLRARAVKIASRIRPWRPWAFEFEPASTEQVQEGYLRHVRDCDAFLWFVTRHTRPNVREELDIALGWNRPVIAFVVSKSLDGSTRALLTRVRRVARTVSLNNPRALDRPLRQALHAELQRRVEAGAMHPPNAFVGRRRELLDLQKLVMPGALVTLHGTGGVGKSRLAAAAFDQWRRRGIAVHWCDLSAAATADDVRAALGTMLGIAQGADASTFDSLASEHMRVLRGVVVLDNAEQVRPSVIDFIRRFREASPSVAVLVTSRELLGADGERPLPVSPFRRPPTTVTTVLRRSEAVRLFIVRAREFGGPTVWRTDDIRRIATLCEQLDGLPYTIELLARQVGNDRRALVGAASSLAELVRQRTAIPNARFDSMEAAFHWSLDALQQSEQDVLLAAAVVRGPIDSDFISRMLSTDVDVRGTLNRLADGPLLLRTGTCFGILNVTRGLCLAIAEERGVSATLRNAHARACGEIATAAVNGNWDDRVAVLVRRYADIDAALDWLVQSRDAASAYGLAGSAYYAYRFTSSFTTGRERLQCVLQLPSPSANAQLPVLQGLTTLARCQSDPVAALRYASMAQQLLGVDAPAAVASPTLIELANTYTDLGDFERAARTYARLRRLWLDARDEIHAATALVSLANARRQQGRIDLALRHIRRAVATLDARRPSRLWTVAVVNYGLVLLYASRPLEALAQFRIAARVHEERDEHLDLAIARLDIALASMDLLYRTRAAAEIRRAGRVFMELGVLQGVAYVLEAAAILASSLERPPAAVTLLAAASRLRKRLHSPRSRAEQAFLLKRIHTKALSAAKHREAVSEGNEMTLRESLRLASAIRP